MQENFYDLAQIVCEAIVKKKFALDPKLFNELIEKVINEAVEDEEYTILVSTDDFSRLQKYHQKKS